MEIIYHHFESLGSTNDWVKRHLKHLTHETLLLVTAETQTAARGQYGRKWFSPAGENIYASFGFFAKESDDPLSLTHLLALSTAQALKKYGVNARLKWPNDLLVNGKKIAGILCETESVSDRLGIALGIGLNINMSSTTLNQINQPATSLLQETGTTHPLPEILSLLKDHFTADLSLFLREGFSPFMEAFRVVTL